eukprot:gene12228-biopygen9473
MRLHFSAVGRHFWAAGGHFRPARASLRPPPPRGHGLGRRGRVGLVQFHVRVADRHRRLSPRRGLEAAHRRAVGTTPLRAARGRGTARQQGLACFCTPRGGWGLGG